MESPNTPIAPVPDASPNTPRPDVALLCPITPLTPTPVTPRLFVPFAWAKTPDLLVPPPCEMARIAVAPLHVTDVAALVELLTPLWTAFASFSAAPAPASTGSARPNRLPTRAVNPPIAPANMPRRVRP